MNLTNRLLKQIIKEELDKILIENFETFEFETQKDWAEALQRVFKIHKDFKSLYSDKSNVSNNIEDLKKYKQIRKEYLDPVELEVQKAHNVLDKIIEDATSGNLDPDTLDSRKDEAYSAMSKSYTKLAIAQIKLAEKIANDSLKLPPNAYEHNISALERTLQFLRDGLKDQAKLDSIKAKK